MADDKTKRGRLAEEEATPSVEQWGSRIVGGVKQMLTEALYLGSKPMETVRHRRRSTVLAGPGFLGFAGGLFNPGAVEGPNGEVHLLCKGQKRHWIDAVGPRYRDYFVGAPVMIRLDASLQIQSAHVVQIEGLPDRVNMGIEDFRLFRRGDEIWSNFHMIDLIREPDRVGYKRSRIALGHLDPARRSLGWRGCPELDFPLQPVEKNWVFFEDGERTRLFYGLSPYRVCSRATTSTGRFETLPVPDLGAALGDVGGFGTLVSNSTNPVVYDSDHLLFLIHQVDPAGFGRLFYHWAVLVDRVTLAPTWISKTPILGGAGARGRYRGVLYAMGVVPREEDVVVFHGEGDSHISYTRFGRRELESSFAPVVAFESWDAPQALH